MSQWNNQHNYSIKSVYLKLMEGKPNVQWAKAIWNRMSLPKHKFIAWIGIQARLKTKDKLYQFNINPDDRCCLCGAETESHAHLFFNCVYSKELIKKLLIWVDVNYATRSIQQWFRWIRSSYSGSKLRKSIMCTVIAAAIYQIWRNRNTAYWLSKVYNVDYVLKDTKYIVKNRINMCNNAKWSSVDIRWVDAL
ncbi:uncharacterized protein LOC104906699 [Beta vulgaris subsp. vulgaris]|uniref:uncharacterized protein LOC104906699 n=1 Tax=Beta vulgaris subsp. vulgaris TaxID=3555 RepID=UPI00053F98EF|nr:uncharacterized protein LOC104906699 [Beta vulgaris subsp. vulgaris]